MLNGFNKYKNVKPKEIGIKLVTYPQSLCNKFITRVCKPKDKLVTKTV